MPVEQTHCDYDSSIGDWLMCRHLVQGEREVKSHRETYLPKLSGQDDADYSAYLARATFYNACDRTVQALAGTVMAKLPSIKWPGKEDFLKSVGPKGETLNQLLLNSLQEDLTTGRYGVLVDAPLTANVTGDEADGEAIGSNPLPYATLYFPENITNWRFEMRDGREQPVLVVLLEMGEPLLAEDQPEDEFDDCKVEQYRVLLLVDGIYTVRLYHKRENKDRNTNNAAAEAEWVVVKEFQPKMWGGKALDFIPFKFVNPSSTDGDIEKSPILDLANANLGHYRLSADYRHGLHYVAMPTIWAAGFDPESSNLRIGAQKAWVTKNEDAKCGMLEMQGAGLSAMKGALEDDKATMAVLGARILEEKKAGVEAAATVQLRNTSEKSILASVAQTVGEAWTAVLEWLYQWMGNKVSSGTDIGITLNQDYSTLQLDGLTLGQLMMGVQQGLISYEMFFYNLKQAQFIPDERLIQDEKDSIGEGLPMPKLNPSDPANQIAVQQAQNQPAVDPSQENKPTPASIAKKKGKAKKTRPPKAPKV